MSFLTFCYLFSVPPCNLKRATLTLFKPGSAPTLPFLFISTHSVLFQGLVYVMEPSKQVNFHAFTQKSFHTELKTHSGCPLPQQHITFHSGVSTSKTVAQVSAAWSRTRNIFASFLVFNKVTVHSLGQLKTPWVSNKNIHFLLRDQLPVTFISHIFLHNPTVTAQSVLNLLLCCRKAWYWVKVILAAYRSYCDSSLNLLTLTKTKWNQPDLHCHLECFQTEWKAQGCAVCGDSK